MRLILIVMILILSGSVQAYQPGYTKVWEVKLNNKISAVQSFVYDVDGKRDDLAVACYDRRVYFFDQNGKLRGSFVGRSSFTALDVYATPDYKRPIRIAAGSLDDIVYSLWRANSIDVYLYSDPEVMKIPKRAVWYFDAGDNINYIHAFDRDEDGIRESLAVGVGSYYSLSPGKLYILNSSGVKIWEKSFGREINFITSFDPDGDTFLSHLVVVYGNTLSVIDKDGKQIWSRTFKNKINWITPADFNSKGELTDLLIAEGNTLHAITSKNIELWSKRFKKEVTSVTGIDRDRDGVVDYYLVASGSWIFALKNSNNNPEILWRYYAGKPVGRFINFDLSSRGVPLDIAVFTNNTLTVYKFTYLSLPQINASIRNNTLIVDNRGDGDATNVHIKIKILSKNRTITVYNMFFDFIKKYESKYINMSGVGNTITVDIYYSDTYGVEYKKNWTFKIRISNNKTEKIQTHLENKSEKEVVNTAKPDLHINITYPDKIKAGKTFNITLKVWNRGSAPAENLNLKLNSSVFQFVCCNISNLVVKPSDIKTINITLKSNKRFLMLRSKEVEIPDITVTYKYGNSHYKKVIRTGKIIITPSRLPLLLIIFLIIGAGVSIFKIRTSQEKNIEDRVAEIYMRYKKAGKVPPYSAFKKLGIDKKTLKEIIIKLKREGKIR